jgi:hypothetical protein
MTYRVYYSDGGIYESGATPPPPRDVQVIIQEHPDIGWHTQSGHDFYVWRGGRWVGVDDFGLYDFLLDTGLVLFGRTMITAEFQEVMTRAIADMGQEKTGWLRDERRPD